jgi:hypothetical protein
MRSAASHTRDPFWPTIASLVAAGWVGGVVASVVTNAALVGTFGLDRGSSVVNSLVVMAALAGCVSSLLLPGILSAVAGARVSLRRAFGAVFAGEAAALCVQLALVALTESEPIPGVFGVLWFVPLAAHVYVSYTLLADSVERATASTEIYSTVRRWLDEAASDSAPQPGRREAYAKALAATRSEVDEAVSSWWGADPTLAERLEARADRIAELDPPDEIGRAAQAMLVRGLRRLEHDLRARRSLAGSEGVEMVEAAFTELRALGLAA